MSYSTSKLKTIAECDESVKLATTRKDDLQFEQTVLGRGLSSQEKAAALTNASLISVNAEMAGTRAAIDAMPDGDAKTTMVNKLRRLNDRKENLEERLLKGGTVALLDTELDAGLLNKQVTEIDTFIAEVKARKAAL